MFFFDLLSRLLKVLRSNESPAQISAGFVLGMILGITPFWSLINFVILFFIIIINVNIAAAMLAYIIFSAVVYLFDPLIHDFGFWLLTDVQFLQPLWISFYHAPLIPYTSFNNTVYLGSLIIAIILITPVFMAVKKFIINYREKYYERVQNWKWIKWLKASKVYNWYERLKFLGG